MLAALLQGFLFLLTLTYLFPLLFMIERSLAGPGGYSLFFYRDILSAGKFGLYYFNSLVLLAVVLLANLFFNLFVAYALSRFEFRGKRILFAAILLTLMVPKQLLLIPSFLLIKSLNLLDTLTGLALPFLIDGFNIFLLKQYLEQIPPDLEESARLDGATDWQILRFLLVPLLKGPLVIATINCAILNWNSFIYPLIFTSSEAKRTLPLALALLSETSFAVSWGHLMAGATLISLPLILLFIVFQRQIVAGILEGALKG